MMVGAHRASRPAWLLAGFALLLCAVGFVLQYVSREVVVGTLYGARGASAAVSIPFAVTGGLLASRRPRNPIGWMYLAVALGTGFVVFGENYVNYSLRVHAQPLPLTDPIAWMQNWMWVLLVMFGLVYPFVLFPDGKLPSRRWRWFLWAAPAVMMTFGLVIAFDPGPLQALPPDYENPYAIGQETADELVSFLGLPFMAVVIASIGAMTGRFRRSSGEQREQMKWLLFAGTLTAACLLANIVSGIASIGGIPFQVIAIATQLSVGGIAVAAGVAVLKYRLYDIDVVINRALVFTALAIAISAIYVGIVAGVGAIAGGGSDPNLGMSILGTAIVAVAFQPLRNRAHAFANRIVYGRRATPDQILSELGSEIAAAASIDEALPKLARLVVDATVAERAAIWLVAGDHLTCAASWPATDANITAQAPLERDGDIGSLTGADHVYPVRHGEELLGALAVGSRPGEALPATDERLLADIASHAGLVLRNAALVSDLRASRQRLVAAQDLERRRIERNLHDGAQQQFVALAVKLRLARTLLDQDASAVGPMLDEMREEASDALENLRALARGIYPPLLAERGLAAALESQVARAAVPVDLEAQAIARFPQEIESAVYFCVLEALQNVAKYAQASRAHVQLHEQNNGVRFAITDDGAGFDPRTVVRGAGLTNMTDRIEALGGTLTITSSARGGTTIEGWIPARAITPA